MIYLVLHFKKFLNIKSYKLSKGSNDYKNWGQLFIPLNPLSSPEEQRPPCPAAVVGKSQMPPPHLGPCSQTPSPRGAYSWLLSSKPDLRLPGLSHVQARGNEGRKARVRPAPSADTRHRREAAWGGQVWPSSQQHRPKERKMHVTNPQGTRS